jgi:dipeptidyl aminopeptidase/acylaminoacyl peptidase
LPDLLDGRQRQDAMRDRTGFRLRFLASLVLCASLAACAEEEIGPQFANDPAPTRPPTATPAAASPVAVAATPVAATPASIADLLATRGAPSRLFVATNDAIWTVSSGGEADRVFEAPPGAEIVAIDAAPGGERVAALLGTTTPEGQRTDVAIIDGAGEIVSRLDGLEAGLATPVPGGDGPTVATIDWSPQADRALVSFLNGATVAFPIGSNDVRTLIPPDGEAGSIVDPSWSPTGESVAFVVASEDDRTRTLRVLDVSAGTVDEVVTPPEGRFVVDYAWMPNGVSLLFTEGGELGGAVTGIDLWRVDADGENRELVVSAGTVAPVARVANVRPAPDGRSVAYSVLVPGEAEPRIDSIWIRDLESRLGFRIQMPSITSINEITWTDRGLAIEVTTGGGSSGRPAARALLQVHRDGSVSALWAAPIAAGTPVSGTPVSTPDID